MLRIKYNCGFPSTCQTRHLGGQGQYWRSISLTSPFLNRFQSVFFLLIIFYHILWHFFIPEPYLPLTSNIDLDLIAPMFDLRFWNMWRGTYIYFLFLAIWRIKRWNWPLILTLTSYIATVFDLRSWNMWSRTYIYVWFWAIWRIER